MTINTEQKIIVITAPSGAGKTSITKHLLKTFPDKLAFSISAATRKPRDNEKNGVDYYFMNPNEFTDKIANNEFVEWEMVYTDKFYGTLKSELARIWKQNKIPVLDVDVTGAIHVQEKYPEKTLLIYIQPPSVDELRRRLQSRGTENSESLHERVEKAPYELSFIHSFNHIIINDDLEKAKMQAEQIVKAFL